MTMAEGRLAPQPWMTAPETRAVIDALSAEGTEVRFVGGCVRNALAGRPVSDVDIATPDPPRRVVRLLEDAGIKAVPTGIDHGTVTAVAGHAPFEVTTLRVDVETYGRHARVAFTDDWEADAARRDLTMNAISCRPDGTLFDPFDGMGDLEAGRIRFVGDARERIEEDYLRLLRFFRFQAHFGRVPPDPAVLDIAEQLAPNLKRLSGERVRDELLKILLAKEPLPVLEMMIRRRILDEVLPEELGTQALQSLLAIEPVAAPPDALRRLAALLRPERSAAEAVAGRLRLSNADTARLVLLAEGPDYLKVDAAVFGSGGAAGADRGMRALRRLLYRLGSANVGDVILLDWARRSAAGAQPDTAILERAQAEIAAWRPRSFPLKGRDVLALGVSHGPAVGKLLDQVEAWWIDQDFAPLRKDCLAKAEALLKGS